MDYKQKYLKYKNKYLELKEQIGGIPCITDGCKLKKAGVTDEMIKRIEEENIYIDRINKNRKTQSTTKILKFDIKKFIKLMTDLKEINDITNREKIIFDIIRYYDIKDFSEGQTELFGKLYIKFQKNVNVNGLELFSIIKNNKDKNEEAIIELVEKNIKAKLTRVKERKKAELARVEKIKKAELARVEEIKKAELARTEALAEKEKIITGQEPEKFKTINIKIGDINKLIKQYNYAEKYTSNTSSQSKGDGFGNRYTENTTIYEPVYFFDLQNQANDLNREIQLINSEFNYYVNFESVKGSTNTPPIDVKKIKYFKLLKIKK